MIFVKIRRRIAEECEHQLPFNNGEFEVDSYLGSQPVLGKRGCGASCKTIVFGLLRRDDRVYTEIVTSCKKDTSQAIRGRVSADAVIHSDGWRSYDGLVNVRYSKHYRVNHSEKEFANSKSHINGIERF